MFSKEGRAKKWLYKWYAWYLLGLRNSVELTKFRMPNVIGPISSIITILELCCGKSESSPIESYHQMLDFHGGRTISLYQIRGTWILPPIPQWATQLQLSAAESSKISLASGLDSKTSANALEISMSWNIPSMPRQHNKGHFVGVVDLQTILTHIISSYP